MTRFRIAFLTVLLFAATFTGAALAVENGGYSNPGALVSAEELEKMIEDQSVKVIDARGNVKYNVRHIVGALDIGVSTLDVEENGVPMMLPDAEKFAEIMSANGITNEDFVVIYDEVGGSQAGRVASAFLQFGHPGVALLDGGWGVWRGKTESQRPSTAPSTFTARDSGLIASIDDVKAALGKPEFVIVDARPPTEYTGEVVMDDVKRGGHIPGAVNINWNGNIDADKFIKSAEELKEMYEAQGVTPDKTVILYCHGGYRSSFAAFILKELLDYPNVLMYDGSWVEWSGADVPVEK